MRSRIIPQPVTQLENETSELLVVDMFCSRIVFISATISLPFNEERRDEMDHID